MTDTDEPIIKGWQCLECLAMYDEHGLCFWCGKRLKPFVEQIPE